MLERSTTHRVTPTRGIAVVLYLQYFLYRQPSYQNMPNHKQLTHTIVTIQKSHMAASPHRPMISVAFHGLFPMPVISTNAVLPTLLITCRARFWPVQCQLPSAGSTCACLIRSLISARTRSNWWVSLEIPYRLVPIRMLYTRL